jgi:hypothetical protein
MKGEILAQFDKKKNIGPHAQQIQVEVFMCRARVMPKELGVPEVCAHPRWNRGVLTSRALPPFYEGITKCQN